MKKISEGAEAEIYESNVAGFPAVVKNRVVKRYRVTQLDSQIREQRTKSEARILSKASVNGINVPKVLMLGKYSISMNRLNGNTLNLVMKKGSVSPNVLKEAGKQLAELHSIDIAHGDYTPANLMIDKNTVWVIDFGLGEMTNSVEEKALDILLMKRSIDKKLYKAFVGSYSKNYKDFRLVLKRLSEIEKRGRYQTRTLLSKV